jgi:chromosomal replication initiation ATPase DnaA
VPRQLAFDLPAKPALGREAFFVSPANELAAAAVAGWRDWPAGKLLVAGPEGAGKTHLAHVFAAEAGAQIVAAGTLLRPAPGERLAVEDVDRIAGDAGAEERLFHLHNLILAGGGRLLLTGRGTPSAWGIALPDLASRILGTPLVRIAPPDDALLAAVLRKHLADRQLIAPAGLIPWLLPRMPRSFAAARELVAGLDAEALAAGRPVSRPMAARILDKMSGAGA